MFKKVLFLMILMAYSIFGYGWSVKTYNMNGSRDSVFMKGVDSFNIVIVVKSRDTLKVKLPKKSNDTLMYIPYTKDTVKIKWFIAKDYENDRGLDSIHFPIIIWYGVGIGITGYKDTAVLKLLPPDFSILNFRISKLGNPLDSTNFLPGDPLLIKWNYKYPSLFDTATKITLSFARNMSGYPHPVDVKILENAKVVTKQDTAFNYVVTDTFTNIQCEIKLTSTLYPKPRYVYTYSYWFASNTFSFDPTTKVISPITLKKTTYSIDNRMYNVLGQRLISLPSRGLLIKNNKLISIINK